MLKIYFGAKPLYLSEGLNEEITAFAERKGTLQLDNTGEEGIKELIHQMKQTEAPAGIVLSDPDKALESLKHHFTFIQAAGGLVYNEHGELLLIYRRGKWDLPKGKLDEGEELATCAVREVEEETGIKNINLESKICVTYHTYDQDLQPVLKESHWYLMRTERNQGFTPQTDEDIEKCEWVKLKVIKPYLEKTHPSILDVLEKGIPLIKVK